MHFLGRLVDFSKHYTYEHNVSVGKVEHSLTPIVKLHWWARKHTKAKRL